MKAMASKSSKRVSVRAKKSLGQNFLMHARIAERIAKAVRIEGETVLEIGPGTGVLTRELLKRAQKVVAVEADPELYEALREDFSDDIGAGRLELISGDIRAYPLTATNVYDRGYLVVANIPYYLTGEIFRLFLSSTNQPVSMTLLVQKEVAERIARSKKESILSLSVKAYGVPKYEFTIPRGAFYPAPKVDSAVISVRDISRGRFRFAREESRFFAFLHAGFAHKRKLLRKNLVEAGFAAEAARVPEKARAEDVPLEAWLKLVRL